MDKRATLQALLTAFAAKEGMPKRQAELFVRTFFELVQEALMQDKFVKIKGFGTFKIVAVGDRESVDVNTGERIQITGHAKVSFVPDNSLKDLINRPFSHFQTVVINEGTDIAALEAISDEEETPGDDPDTDDAEMPQATDNEETADNSPIPGTASPPEEGSEDISDNHKTPYAMRQTDDDRAEDKKPIAPQGPATDEAMPTDNAPASGTPSPPVAADETPDTDRPQETTTPPTQPPTTETEAADEGQDEAAPQDETATPAGEEGREGEKAATISFASPEEEEGRAVAAPQETDTTRDDGQDTRAEGKATKDTARRKAQTPPGTDFPPPPARESNWWKITISIILVLLLMMLSYFAGYFRLFYPCEQLGAWHFRYFGCPVPEQGQHSPAQTAPVPPPRPLPAQTAADSLTAQPSTPAPEAAGDTLSATAPAGTAAETAKQPADNTTRTVDTKYRYIIVGTRDNYIVSRGETVRSIAEHVYGSRGYAPYIIRHNQLTNPDDIHAGMILRLPELERNPNYRP